VQHLAQSASRAANATARAASHAAR
jgi:hypothetical protein